MQLQRKLGLLGLAATGICSMLGASVYVVPFMIQRNVPGIGPNVLPAFVFAALPAVFAAIAYAILASAMPRAGGSYIYASRGLHPYLGFVASFSQWFGLSIAIGVISYIIIPFLRDIAIAIEWEGIASMLSNGSIRVGLALLILWFFVWVNIRGIKFYERTLIPLMFLMFGLGAIVILFGFSSSQETFVQAVEAKEGIQIVSQDIPFSWSTFLSAAALLFASFIGFDSIAQAGGEAKKPGKNLPIAIGLAILTVGSFYFLFTAAVYHTVPWEFVAQQAMEKDITAPGLLSYILSPVWAVAIVGGAAIALINDLPAMLLSVSRLMFAWAKDGIFPKKIATIHEKRQTPHFALLASGAMATIGILGSHFAGDFFLGIDIMVTSMLVNFLLMCVTVITLPAVNGKLANEVKIMQSRAGQLLFSIVGTILLFLFLIVHIAKDLNSKVEAWYFHSTWVWLIVMTIASLLFYLSWNKLENRSKIFSELPAE